MGVQEDADEQEPPFRGGDLETRLGLIERDSRSHARSLTEISTRYAGLEHRVDELTTWRMNEMLAAAREEERDKALMDRLNRIDTNISDLKAGPNRLLWLVISNAMPAIVFGVAWFIARGGP
jgi:hypothetical protein